MTTFTRTLTIHSDNLGAEATLVLTFDSQPMPGMYQNYFPTAWRVATFGPTGPYSIVSTLTFMKPQFQSDNVVTASTWVDINPGQETTMTEDKAGVYSFSPPTPGTASEIQAQNGVQSIQNIGVGFDNGQIPPPIALLFTGVGSQSSVSATFDPILNAYIYPNHQQNAVIQAEIPTRVIWTQNLAALDPNTSWTLARTPAGVYTITQDAVAEAMDRPIGNLSRGVLKRRGDGDVHDLIKDLEAKVDRLPTLPDGQQQYQEIHELFSRLKESIK